MKDDAFTDAANNAISCPKAMEESHDFVDASEVSAVEDISMMANSFRRRRLRSLVEAGCASRKE